MKRIAITLLLTACAVAQNSDKPQPSKDDPILKAARDLRGMMRDPDSFRVNEVYLKTVKNDKQEVTGEYLCFDYRSKNGMGGYVNGKTVGVVSAKDGQLRMPPVDLQNVWGIAYSTFCAETNKPSETVEKKDVTDSVKAALKADRDKEGD